MVATITFGMGIDKPDIRYACYYNLSKSLESLSQEIGRAGRDGEPSTCEMFLCPDDLNRLENFAYGDTPDQQDVESFLKHLAPGSCSKTAFRLAFSSQKKRVHQDTRRGGGRQRHEQCGSIC